MMLGLALGVLAGAPAGYLIHVLLQRRREPLAAAECRDIEQQVRSHVTAVNAQVSEFADQLADGDPVLRAQLRRFETGERS